MCEDERKKEHELEERIKRYQEVVRSRKQNEAAEEKNRKQQEIEEKRKQQQELQKRIKWQEEAEMLRKLKESEERITKQEQEAIEKAGKRQEEQERLKRYQEFAKLRKQKEAEEITRTLQEEEKRKKQQERQERVKRYQEAVRLRKEKEAEEKIRKQQQEERLKQEQQLQERIKRMQELERLRKEKEAEENIRKQQEEERLKQEQQLQERIKRMQESERLRKEKEAEEKIRKQQEEERLKQEQQLQERIKRMHESERLRKEKEAEEKIRKHEEERLKQEQQLQERIKKMHESDRLRKEKEAEEKIRKQHEEARLKQEQQLQERIKRMHESERLRKEKEAEEKIRKHEEERLKQEQQLQERIKKMHESDRLRKEKEAEEKIRKQHEEARLKQEQQLQERIKRIQELERNRKHQAEEMLRIQYFAGLRLEYTCPRKVKVWVQFDHTTHRRLVEELIKYSGDKANLRFSLTVTNLQTHVKRSDQFQKNVNLRTGLPLECSLKLGNRYKFEVNVKKYSPIHRDFTIFLTKAIEHKEILLKSELQTLMQKAKQFQEYRLNRQRLPVRSGYRNKPRLYFDQIKRCRSNIMEVYIKDNNGDPGCPINGQINGLFFAVRPEPSTMAIPTESLFGNTRIILPIEKLAESCPNFYFADFYCHKKIHYLTLVATKPNSQADQFCRDHLLEISLDNNTFFFREASLFTGAAEFYCCRAPRVEILYTENVDLNQHYIKWETVGTIGRGSSTQGGLPKRRLCSTCNLYPFQSLLGDPNSF